MNSRKISIILIFCLAAFLRLYQLGNVPNGFDWDEASIGYNAYSILKTGKDEYGNFLPLTFRSFGDYKPPLYFYLTVPSIAFFGLNEFAVRLPAAILGIIAVMATFFLIELLFKDSLQKFKISTIGGLFMAISPWHLQFSRVAFEAGAGLTLVILGTLYFLKGLFYKQSYFYLSAVFFSLSLYAYHTEKIFTPLFILGLIIIYRKLVLAQKKSLILAVLFFLLLQVPLIVSLFSPDELSRFSGVSIYTHQLEALRENSLKISEDKNSGLILSEIFHNRRIVYAQKFIEGYLTHFSLNWLFITGDQERHHVPGMGLLYLAELPLLLYGIYTLVFKEKTARNLLLFWIAISPVAAAPTIDLPHAVRTLVFLPALPIVSAYGFVSLLNNPASVRNKILKYGFSTILFFNVFYYFHQYYKHLPLDYAKNWQYGYKALVADVKKSYNKYDRFIISEKLEQPYIFFLFYLQYDPQKYHLMGGTNNRKDDYFAFDKYIFKKLFWQKENSNPKYLYIGRPEEIMSVPIKKISYPNGEIAVSLGHK